MTSLFQFFFPKREKAFDLTAWLSRSAEVSAFNVTDQISRVEDRAGKSLCVAFAIRCTRPLAMEA